MSDTGIDSDYFSTDDNDLLEQMYQYGLMGEQNRLPGDSVQDRLNFYQDVTSTLGFDQIQQAGLGGTQEDVAPVPQRAEPINEARAVYGNNQAYSEIFDLIDQGFDPVTAVNTVDAKAKSGGFQNVEWSDDPETLAQVADTASQYAFEKVGNENDRLAFDQKNANDQAKAQGSYTKTDGSKYKNAPLGGPDINATASEYDLMGAPSVDELMSQYAEQTAGKRLFKAAPLPKEEAQGPTGPRAPRSRTPKGTAAKDDVLRATQEREFGKTTLKPSLQLIGGSAGIDAATRKALAKRLEATKSTQVRSDANRNAMMRLTAFRTMIGA